MNKMPAISPSSRAWLIGGLLFNANLDVHGARFFEHQCQSESVIGAERLFQPAQHDVRAV